MASSSNTQTNMNPREQVDDLNQNQNPSQNRHQSSSIDPKNPITTNASHIQHIDNNTYVFTIPIKLTQNNFMLWKSQLISNIKANELEGFIDGSHACPPRFFMNPGQNQTIVTAPNPEYKF